MNQPAAHLRSQAEGLASSLPPLLAEAERLAMGVVPGVHGRRRAGMGETFWQYRQAMPGDAASTIDWRRSARGDALFIKQTEWEAAQSVQFWVDWGPGMGFSSADHPTKGARANLLGLALAVLLARAGERIGLLATPLDRPQAGRNQVARFAATLATPPANPATFAEAEEFPAPGAAIPGHYVLISDFLMEETTLLAGLHRLAQRGVRGAVLQISDPAEESFPYDGRVIFESMSAPLRFETRRARGLRAAYQARLAERRALLGEWAQRHGWQFSPHRTDHAPATALLWLYAAIGGRT